MSTTLWVVAIAVTGGLVALIGFWIGYWVGNINQGEYHERSRNNLPVEQDGGRKLPTPEPPTPEPSHQEETS